MSTESAELLKGEKKVTQAGVAGKVDKTFKLVLVDGREASRTLVSEAVSVQPVTEKITVGTKAKPAARGAGRGRQHRCCGPGHDERSHVGQDRPVRVRRKLVHQHAATATTAACSSTSGPGSAPAAAPTPRMPAWPPRPSRSTSPTRSTRSVACSRGAAAGPLQARHPQTPVPAAADHSRQVHRQQAGPGISGAGHCR